MKEQVICIESSLVGGRCSNERCKPHRDPHSQKETCVLNCPTDIVTARCVPLKWRCELWDRCDHKWCASRHPRNAQEVAHWTDRKSQCYYAAEKYGIPAINLKPCIDPTPTPKKEDQKMTKLVIAKDFCIFDLIQAHHHEYKGATCSKWREDLAWMLSAQDINTFYCGTDALQLDRPERAELRTHLIKWGFVKEELQKLRITKITVEEAGDQLWNITAYTRQSTRTILQISPEGFARIGRIDEQAFATIDGGKIKEYY